MEYSKIFKKNITRDSPKSLLKILIKSLKFLSKNKSKKQQLNSNQQQCQIKKHYKILLNNKKEKKSLFHNKKKCKIPSYHKKRKSISIQLTHTTEEKMKNTRGVNKFVKYRSLFKSSLMQKQKKQKQYSINIQLKVKIQNKFISVKNKQGNTLIQGQLYQKINTSESIWKIQNIAGKNYLNFNLEKTEQKIWSTVFIGDPQIDTTKVNNSKPLQDFDQQTQGAIRKIMYEQQRKQQGLPTTDEEKQYQALKQAWNAEGSPFKGTPFDPSKLNLSGFKP